MCYIATVRYVSILVDSGALVGANVSPAHVVRTSHLRRHIAEGAERLRGMATVR